MANTALQVFRTATAGRQPNTTSSGNSQYINAGGLALNMPDQIMYTSNGSTLIVVGANAPAYSVSGGNVSINSAGVFVANSTGVINAATYSVGTTFTANATLVNAAAINITGQTNTATLFVTTSANVGTAFVANSIGAYHTGTVNAASHTVGTAFVANSIGAYHTGTVNAASHTVGTAFVANSIGAYHTGTVNAASHTVGTAFVANSIGVTSTGFANITTTLAAGNTAITGSLTVSTNINSSRINPRIGTTTGATSPITPTGDTSDQYNVTAAGAALTINAPSGTPVDGQKLTIRIKDNATARALTWTTSAGGYRIIGTTLPTTTVISKTIYVGCIYNAADTFWDVIAVAQQA